MKQSRRKVTKLDVAKIKNLLTAVKQGDIEISEAMETLKSLPYEDLGFAKIDHHRQIRSGFPEVIFCQGKTPAQTVAIFGSLAAHNNTVLGTRTSEDTFLEVQKAFPTVEYDPVARTILLRQGTQITPKGNVLVVTAGTSDIPVAKEAAVCAEAMGTKVTSLFDVGVAGIHRLLNQRHHLNDADVIIVVAGMEGALASVVGGMTDKPVIAVPTSIGYGANFGGLSALLAMLNSCASGVGVVNIDNGYGAAALAAAILKIREV